LRSYLHLSICALLFFAAQAAFPCRAIAAADEAAAAPAVASEGTSVETKTGLTQSLDRRYRFPKHMQSEISVFGGDYLGDEWLNTWDAGASYHLHINETLAVGAAYTVSRIRDDASSSFGKSLTSKMTHLADAELMIGNNCAFRVGRSVIDCDLFATLGGGGIWINGMWEPLGIFGGGMEIFLPMPWLALRVDVDSVVHPTPKPEGNSINADVMFNLGVSFLFPTRRAETPAGGQNPGNPQQTK